MTRAGIFIASLASLVVATVVTGSVLRAEATDGAQPDTSCATTAACIEGDNTSTGPGVKGTSTKGHGMIGTTKSKGTTSGTDHAGVLGQDLQTGGGNGNVGVEGTSTHGVGVSGSTTDYIGVLGKSISAVGIEGIGFDGVEGFGEDSLSIGVFGVGVSEGVEGENNSVGDAIFANGQGGLLFRGSSSSSIDVFTVDNGGNVGMAGNLNDGGFVDGVVGGGFGSQSSSGTGVFGASNSEGVEGENNTTGDAVFANGFGGLLFRGNNSQAQDVFSVDDGGNVFAVSYNFVADATKLQRTSMGATVKTYSSQAAQPTLEDTGEAQLVNGIARVPLDPSFAATIDRLHYVVLVTPQGMTQGMLCVAQRTPSGFVVQENMNGHSDVTFAYRIVAKPYGDNAPRLPLAMVPGHFGQRVAKTRLQVHAYKAQYHAKPAQIRFPHN